jgi:hypothetical protein
MSLCGQASTKMQTARALDALLSEPVGRALVQ